MLLRDDLLTVATRNVEQSRDQVNRQRSVVRNMQAAGLETQINEDVLRMFERSLAKCEAALARLSPTEAVSITGPMDPEIGPEQ